MLSVLVPVIAYGVVIGAALLMALGLAVSRRIAWRETCAIAVLACAAAGAVAGHVALAQGDGEKRDLGSVATTRGSAKAGDVGERAVLVVFAREVAAAPPVLLIGWIGCGGENRGMTRF